MTKPSQETNAAKGSKSAAADADQLIGRRVRDARKNAGLTLAELAGKVGLSLQQLQKYESGQSRLSAAKILELADALSLPLSYFFETLQTKGRVRSRPEPDTAMLRANIARALENIRDREVLNSLYVLVQHLARTK